MDELSIYDRKGKKQSSSTGLMFPLLLSVAVIAGSVALIEYGIPSKGSDAPVQAQVKTSTSVSTYGVISRSPVVPIDRTARQEQQEDIQLIEAAAKTTEVTSLVEPISQPAEPSAQAVNQPPPTPQPFETTIRDGSDVSVVLPAEEVKQASDEEIERLYSSLPEKTDEVEVFVEEVLPVEEAQPLVNAEPTPEPVVNRAPPRRTVRAARPKPVGARCLISRRELAGVRASQANEELGEERMKFLSEQESYYWGQVTEHCR